LPKSTSIIWTGSHEFGAASLHRRVRSKGISMNTVCSPMMARVEKAACTGHFVIFLVATA
jgi:hypothetical protein